MPAAIVMLALSASGREDPANEKKTRDVTFDITI
jgi:hypothetical protein